MTAAMKDTNWTPADTLAHRFLLVRTQLGMDRKSFAALTGLTENQLQSIETGRSPRDLATKVQLVHEATGVDREWLMWGGPLEQKSPRHLGMSDGGTRGINAEYRPQKSTCLRNHRPRSAGISPRLTQLRRNDPTTAQ